MYKHLTGLLLVFAVAFAATFGLEAQNLPTVGAVSGQLSPALYYRVAASATAAVNTQTTITIPAPPPGLYNYICTLDINASRQNTGTTTPLTNAVTTSNNMGNFAFKFSNAASVNNNFDKGVDWG